MPYIAPEDRQALEPSIEELKAEIIKITDDDPHGRDTVWGYLKVAALAIIGPCAVGTGLILNPEYGASKIRYWMIAVLDGLLVDVSTELKRALNLPEVTTRQEIGFKQLYQRETQRKLRSLSISTKQELLDIIYRTVVEIMTTAKKEPKSIAFAGLCNYFFTELGARVIMEVYGPDFNLELAQFLAFFWLKVKDDLYKEIAAPYEDEKKKQNGDCPNFIKMREILALPTQN